MESTATIKLFQKRDFGQIINTTFSFIRLVAKSYFKNLLLFSAPAYALAGLISSVYQFDTLSGNQAESLFPNLLVLFLYSVGAVFSAVISAKHLLVYQKEGRTEISTDEMKNYIKVDFLRVLAISIIYYVIIIVGAVFLLIPGIYYGVALSLCIIITVLEPEATIAFSFQESLRLIKDNWWASFGLYIVIGFITYVLIIVMMLPQLISTLLISYNTISGTSSDAYRIYHIALSVISQIGYALTSAIPLVTLGIYYYSLREKKDEVSMLAKIEEIGNQEVESNEDSY